MGISKSKFSMPITFQKVDEHVIGDNRFTRVKCWLMHTGKNLNNSWFDKNVIEEAIPTLEYIPIVGFIELDDFNEPDFSDHRYILVRTREGIEERYPGSAYGVILSNADNEAHFETKICSDGQEREFIVCNGIIWNQFETSADIFMRDLEKSHSIELDENSIDGYEDENGCFVFTKFSFKAACVLGDCTPPAMIDSNISVNFTMNDVVSSIRSELNDKLEKFNMAFAKFTNDETFSDQGGAKNMLNTDLDQVSEAAEEIVAPEAIEVETEFEEAVEVEAEVVEDKVEEVEGVEEEQKAEFAEVEAEAEVDAEVDETIVEEAASFEQVAEVEEVSEAEAEAEDDKPVVEEDAKFSEMQAEIDGVKAEYAKVKSEYDEMFSSYEKLKSEYDEMKPKYDEYVRAEELRAAEALSAQKDAVFAEYEDKLSGNDEFAALKEKKDDMSLDDIEKECAFLYVRIDRAKNKFSSVESQSAVVGVMNDIDSDELDGFVNTKYGLIPISR